MKKEKIMYISDLDGTLLNGNAELSEYTKTTLNSLIAGGLNFSVATARTLASTSKILADLTLDIPIVLMNGVLTYNIMKKRYIKVNALQIEMVSAVIDTLRRFETTGFMYELKNDELMTYHESLERKPLRDFVNERIARYYKSFRHADSFSDISPENIIYFTLLDVYERLQPVHDALAIHSNLNQTLYKDNYSPDLWYLEIFSAAASKQNGVMYLRETCGFEKIVGFGDNLNDLPMFAACDVKVAVENAKPEVKAAADYICDTNENDGVAKWLEENVL